jgi:hypothetical protein
MLDTIEGIFAQAKRDDIERVVQRQKLRAEIDQPKRGSRLRRAVAGALMRIAMVIDESADGRIVETAAQ